MPRVPGAGGLGGATLRGSFAALGAELGTELAAEQAEGAGRVARLGLLAWWVRHGRRGLAALALLLAVLAAGLLVEQGRLRREQAAVRTAAALPARPPDATVERDRLAAKGRRLAEGLAASRERGEELARRLAALTRPQVNTAIFSLGLVRGEEKPGRVLVGAEPEWIVLAVELPSPLAETYRAALVDAHGRALWRGEGLHPAANDTLVLTLYSDLLPPGAYRLVLTAPGQAGTSEVPFEVARRAGPR